MRIPIFRYIETTAVLAAVALCLPSCGSDSPDGEDTPPAPITVSTESLDFDCEGGELSFTITTPSEWDAVSSDAWISLSKSNQLRNEGTVTVTVGQNPSTDPRIGTIMLMSSSSSTNVTVRQTGKPKDPVDTSIKAPEGYTLVWHDEFDGSELNRSWWTHEVQGPGWVNNELQTYVNTSYDGHPVTEVKDGVLNINCFKAKDGKICSGRIYAQVNTGWKYGIFEARIKLPRGKGTWPAFWMMPVNNNFSTNPWPRCGEIDIMEEVGYHPDYTSSSIHCESYNHTIGTQRTAERLTQGAQDDFHIYRLEWTEDAIRTYVDDTPLLTFANDGKNNVSTWPFNRSFYLILNLAWGGSWGGAQGVDESCLPATMTVDYVRVFQK